MKSKEGCLRHNIPKTLEDVKQQQPLFWEESGTDSGCTWRDSLGLQLRIPAPVAASGSGTHLTENIWDCEPGYCLLLVSMVPSAQILSPLEAWPEIITAFHFWLSLRKRVSSVPAGPWVWGNPSRNIYKVRESTLTLKRSKFSIIQFLLPQ